MLYPKCFEKRADATSVMLDEALPSVIGMARRANKINNIVHAHPELDAPTEEDIAAGEDASGLPPLYVKHEGQIYPAVFGYQVPTQLIPRVIKPVLRNLPEGEL